MYLEAEGNDLKFFAGVVLLSVLLFGSIFTTQAGHFDDRVNACRNAQGRGELVKDSFGIPIEYECMRMHLVLKYRNGEYK